MGLVFNVLTVPQRFIYNFDSILICLIVQPTDWLTLSGVIRPACKKYFSSNLLCFFGYLQGTTGLSKTMVCCIYYKQIETRLAGVLAI